MNSCDPFSDSCPDTQTHIHARTHLPSSLGDRAVSSKWANLSEVREGARCWHALQDHFPRTPLISWFGPSVWDGDPGFLASEVSLLASLFPLPLPTWTPRAAQQTFFQQGQGAGGRRSRRWGGCCEEPPWIPGPGVHLQTDVSNESPGTRRAEAAGGLAGAEVMVNYFRAAPPPLSATTVAKIPRRQEQESGFHMG